MDMSGGTCMPDTVVGSLQILSHLLSQRKFYIYPILQIGRLREVTRVVQGHTANKWWS